MSEISPSPDLSKRERQVMDIIMRLKKATAREVERELPEAPTYSAVRSILRVLVNKGLLIKKHEDDRDVFSSAAPASVVRTSFLRSLVRNFFADSAADAACALLGQKNLKLTPAEADKLIAIIKEARKS